jgi:tRNA threonylcarbamoyl adenosine modification protein YeaZ
MDSATDIFIASESLLMDRGHAEALMPLIERVIAKVEGGFGSIDKIAVSVGPGSFTGLRVGLSAARGIALGLEVPAVGITTLTALSVPHIDGDERSLIVSAIDARHGHMYAQIVSGAGQVFRLDHNVIMQAADGQGDGHDGVHLGCLGQFARIGPAREGAERLQTVARCQTRARLGTLGQPPCPKDPP